MLDPKHLRHDINAIAAQLNLRGFVVDVEKFNTLEAQRKSLQVSMQQLQNERNVRSKEVGMAKAAGRDATEIMSGLKALSDELKIAEDKLAAVNQTLDDFLAHLPNLTHASVPVGKSEEENVVIRTWGEPTRFDFHPKDHVELGAGGIDFEVAAKITGARFVVLKGAFAALQRALVQFMLDLHVTQHGYQEIAVPYLVNADSLFGTGQFPKLKEDVFAVSGVGEHAYYLIPTSEVPVTNTIRDEIIPIEALPLKYVCYSACFRSEAGSYGKDMRGMIRQHQFEKVELVQIVHPDQSYAALENLTQHAEAVLQTLELPYRVSSLCTGDIGFAAAKTYDLEVWLPGQGKYREISSCSNCESFQARRLKARFRDHEGKLDLVHTLNGSALAVGRTLVAIVENYQDALGRVHIPKALQPYMRGLKVIE